MAYKPVTPQQYDSALKDGGERLSRIIQADGVRYDRDHDVVVIKLSDKASVEVERAAIPEWSSLSMDDMQEIRLSAVRDAIAVGSYDVHVSIEGLLRDVLPVAFLSRAFAQRGGTATSDAKAAAVRSNGARGGRPRKIAVGM